MNQEYTQREVARMTGLSARELSYWGRLGLVRPKSRWGQRFYSFADLVALETIKKLTDHRVPARRVRRAIEALSRHAGGALRPVSALRLFPNGREVVAIPPGSKPLEPLTGQFVLDFHADPSLGQVRPLSTRSAEEWFEMGLAYDASPETLGKAAEAYRRALELAPDWIEAHINLGTTLYQLSRAEEAKWIFASAVALDPNHPLVHFNLGCVLESLGQTHASIEHLKRAVELAPQLADAHLNLALAYEKRGNSQLARRHLALYLQYEPDGPWAEFARERVRAKPQGTSPETKKTGPKPSKVTPFRKP